MHVPSLATGGGNAQIDCDEEQAGEDGLVDGFSGRGRQQGQGKVDDALCRIVRAYDPEKEWVIGEGILLQGCQVVVAVVLQAGGQQKERQTEERPRPGDTGDLQMIESDIVGEDGAWNLMSQPARSMRSSRTCSFNPHGQGHCYVEGDSQQPMHEPHLRGRWLRRGQTLVEPAATLDGHQRPTQHDLVQRHGSGSMLLVDVRRDESERGAAGEQLGGPEDGRQQRDDIEMGEVAVRHPPGCEVVDEAGDWGSGRVGRGGIGSTRAIVDEAGTKVGDQTDGQRLLWTSQPTWEDGQATEPARTVQVAKRKKARTASIASMLVDWRVDSFHPTMWEMAISASPFCFFFFSAFCRGRDEESKRANVTAMTAPVVGLSEKLGRRADGDARTAEAVWARENTYAVLSA